MKRNVIEAYGLADRFSKSTKQQAVKKIFFRNISSLEGTVIDAYPAINPTDARSIIRSLFVNIPRYSGRPEDFLSWARKLVTAEAFRYEFTERIWRDRGCVGAIYRGIRRGLSSRYADPIVDPADVESEVFALIFTMAHELAKPSRANIRTRLCSLARKHAYGYHTKKQRERYRIVSQHLRQAGKLYCDHLSPLELESIAAAEREYIAA